MANALAPAEWKKVLKDHKDGPDTTDVTKALDAYAKVEPKAKDAPQPVLDALGEVVDAAKAARSANAKDKTYKPVVDFLDDVLKDAATMKVKVERFLQEKNERDREGEDDEGGDDERAKLTAQLIKVKKLDADVRQGVRAGAGREGPRTGDLEDPRRLQRPQEARPRDARRQRQGLPRAWSTARAGSTSSRLRSSPPTASPRRSRRPPRSTPTCRRSG